LELLEGHGLSPNKALGQNFVIDPNTVERIARLSGVGPGDHVLEIGAGLGSLTLALAHTGAEVKAIEIDHGLTAVLRSIVPPEVSVIEADALKCDYAHLLAQGGRSVSGDETPDPWVLVANLPYNIATPVILTLLEGAPEIKAMLVMVQRDMAERFVAVPGTKSYGAVSVRMAYFATLEVVGRVSREVFFPRPHVDSALVGIKRRDRPAVDPAVASYEELNALVRAGFSGRRKMLRRSLAGLVDEEAFSRAGIEPTARAENLDVFSWGKLAGCQRSNTK
jgi:16S rRNA (adenine1518-N6/adenine1519-N6)-dimethyltransferase